MLTITPIVDNVTFLSADDGQIIWKALDSSSQDYELFLFDGYQTIQLSDNEVEEFSPQLDNGQVVWYQSDDHDNEIYLYDGEQILQLTDNENNDYFPQISNGQVFWYRDGENDILDIFRYDGEAIVEVALSNPNKDNVQFYGNGIVWDGSEPTAEETDREIWLYDDGQTRKLSDNQFEDILVAVEGNYIVWSSYDRINSTKQLFLYDGSETKKLTTDGLDGVIDPDIDIDNQNVVWIENNEIFLYDGRNTKQISDDEISKSSVQTSGTNIVWLTTPSYFDYKVFLYNGSTIAQITDGGNHKSSLQIDGDNITWVSHGSYAGPSPPGYDGRNFDIYIYSNGEVSPLAVTNHDEFVLSLNGNSLLGYIDDYRGQFDYIKAEQLFLATWTDDTFPVLSYPDQYGASYPDLIVGYGYNLDALEQHYYQYGRAEGRSRDLFDEFEYLASNPDLIEGYGYDGTAATRHYIEHGYAEGRDLDSFDALSYLAANDTLIRDFGFNLKAVTRHYVRTGFHSPDYYYYSLTFDANRYIASYPDLIGGYGGDSFEGVDSRGATEHYVRYGLSEGRTPTLFDPVAYMQAYADIATGYNNDAAQATLHYITYGYDEGRSIVASI